jgi:hypothetical protein
VSRWRSLAVAAAVVAAVLLFALAVPLLNKAVSPTVDVSGERFALAGVTVTAPDGTRMRPGHYRPESGRAEFLVGGAEVAIAVAEPYRFDAEYLADEMARLLEVQPGVQLTEPRTCAADGVEGAGRGFVTETRAGFACAFVHGDTRVEVTASGALDRAPLGSASIEGASLDSASLDSASPGSASLDSASPGSASFDGASRGGAALDGASLDPGTVDRIDALIAGLSFEAG